MEHGGMEAGPAMGGTGELPPTPFPFRLVPPKNPTCNNCRISKIRCDRVFPCSRCIRLNLECIYEPRKRRRMASDAPPPAPPMYPYQPQAPQPSYAQPWMQPSYPQHQQPGYLGPPMGGPSMAGPSMGGPSHGMHGGMPGMPPSMPPHIPSAMPAALPPAQSLYQGQPHHAQDHMGQLPPQMHTNPEAERDMKAEDDILAFVRDFSNEGGAVSCAAIWKRGQMTLHSNERYASVYMTRPRMEELATGQNDPIDIWCRILCHGFKEAFLQAYHEAWRRTVVDKHQLSSMYTKVVDRFGYEVVCLLHLRVRTSSCGKFRAAILHLKPMPHSRVALDAVKRTGCEGLGCGMSHDPYYNPVPPVNVPGPTVPGTPVPRPPTPPTPAAMPTPGPMLPGGAGPRPPGQEMFNYPPTVPPPYYGRPPAVQGKTCLACKRSKVRCNRMTPCARCVRLNLECRPNPRPPGRPQILNTPLLGATGAPPSAHESAAAHGPAPRPERVLNRLLTPPTNGVSEGGSAETGAAGARQPLDAVPAALTRFVTKGTLVTEKARWILLSWQAWNRTQGGDCTSGRLASVSTLTGINPATADGGSNGVDGLLEGEVGDGQEEEGVPEASLLEAFAKECVAQEGAALCSVFFRQGAIETEANERFDAMYMPRATVEAALKTELVRPEGLFERLFSGEYRQCFQEMYAEAAFCFAARASEGSRVLRVSDRFGHESAALVTLRHYASPKGVYSGTSLSIAPLPYGPSIWTMLRP